MHIILIYIGLLFGIFIEGEMIMISSVIAAHHGYLNLWIVIVLGIIGTILSDLFYFNLGKKKGKDWIRKNEKLSKKLVIIDKRIESHPVLIFIGYRFLYGFRTIVPLTLGAGSTKTRTFMFFCFLSTILWAIVYCTAGYFFGELIKAQLQHIEHLEKFVIGVLLLISIIFIVLKRKYKTNLKT